MTTRAAKSAPASPGTHAAAAPRGFVGIGASAGGLEAFTEFVSNLPAETGLAFVLVQHLDPTHRSLLTELLARSATLPIGEIVDDVKAAPDRIYVIPPNHTLTIEAGVLRLRPRGEKAGGSRTIDEFFRSLAADQGEKAIAVVLSGAGSDGAKGLVTVKEAGGLTFAQSEASSKYDSMPRSAIATGCVDFVLTPRAIAEEIARHVVRPHGTRARAAAQARGRRKPSGTRAPFLRISGEVTPDLPQGPENEDLRKVLQVLHTRTALDFRLYRMNTVRRRLARRVAATKTGSLADYLRILRENDDEVQLLYQDLLVNVTNFFRNPKIFDAIQAEVFPALVKDRPEGEALRIWVAGCSTGEEAYSLAMAYLEFCESSGTRFPLQIFASDVNPRVLEIARNGFYSRSAVKGLSRTRLARFFHEEETGFRAQKQLREMVIFAEHNLLAAPPFTRLDVVSCRNMLIYIEPSLQQRIIPTFHYALKPDGYLVLGTSESIGGYSTLFEAVDDAPKIFRKKSGVTRPMTESLSQAKSTKVARSAPAASPTLAGAGAGAGAGTGTSGGTGNGGDLLREADRVAINHYAPPAVVVGEDGVILQFRGPVQDYLELPSGRATLNVTRMARGGAGLIIQKMLEQARRSSKTVRRKSVLIDGIRQPVNLDVVPVTVAHSRCFLVVFIPAAVKPAKGRKAAAAPTVRSSAQMRELRQEVVQRGEQLDVLREQHDVVVEELQSANEEVQSANEELQSLNEELETSNEELESANEELTTLNEELATRNTELRESERRLRQQAQLVELAPLVVRSAQDRVIFWSVGAEQLYEFSKEEAVGQSSHHLLRAEYGQPLEKIMEELEREGRWTGEITQRTKDGRRIVVSTQWVANRDEAGRLHSILEVNSDLTARRQAEESLREVQELNRQILDSSPDTIVVTDLAGRIVFAKAPADQRPESTLATQEGAHWSELWAEDTRGEADAAHRAALQGRTHRFHGVSDGGNAPVWWDVVMRPIHDAKGRPTQLLAVCRDVTEQRIADEERARESRFAALRADIAVELARGDAIESIAERAAHFVIQHTGVSLVRVWLGDAGSTPLRLAVHAGRVLPPTLSEGLGESRARAIAHARRPYFTHDVASDPEITGARWSEHDHMATFAGYPLLYESRVLGVLVVLARERMEPRLVREIGLVADSLALVVQRKIVEDERSRLYQEAMEARNSAVAASRAKDNFLAALSHELRTPLNPVMLIASEGARDQAQTPEVRELFATIRNSIELEARLIDDLLDVNRIAAGKMEFEMTAMDLHVTVREAIGIVARSPVGEEVTITSELKAANARVVGDPVRLQQVLWNVLNNAVKFSPSGGHVRVETTNPDEHRIVIAVTDDGVGLAPEDLDRIFESFLQVERRQGGLGLGLAISRGILERHQGAIRAQSGGPGRGSTFEIELPLAGAESKIDPQGKGRAPVSAAPKEVAASSVPPGDGRPSPNGESKRRLLLVEDHEHTRKTLGIMLKRRGFDVVVADSVAQARARAAESTFDLFVSDLGLPDGDGCSLLVHLRERHPGVPAIAMSGYGTEEDRARTRAAGFTLHLVKPVSIDELDWGIARAFGETTEPEASVRYD